MPEYVRRIRYDEILTVGFLFLGRAQQISRFVFKTVIAAKDYLILSFPEWKNHFFRTELCAIRIQMLGYQFSVQVDLHSISGTNFRQNML